MWSHWSIESGTGQSSATWCGGEEEIPERSGKITQPTGGAVTSSMRRTPSRPMRLKYRPSITLVLDQNLLWSLDTQERTVSDAQHSCLHVHASTHVHYVGTGHDKYYKNFLYTFTQLMKFSNMAWFNRSNCCSSWPACLRCWEHEADSPLAACSPSHHHGAD